MDCSFVAFSPQCWVPSAAYLDSIQSYIANHPILKHIKEQISTLRDVWSLLAEQNKDIAALAQGPEYMDYLIRWIEDGEAKPLAPIQSSIAILPRLCIIGVAQYFQFLESRGESHADFLSRVRESGGGIQGCCGGLPAAIAIATAADEQEIARTILTSIRFAFAIGLYMELGDDSRVPGSSALVVRVKKLEQAEELVRMFPRV